MVHPHDGTTGRTPHRRTSEPATPSAAVLTPPAGLPAVPQQRTAPEPDSSRPGTPPARPAVRRCACGHPQDMHEHYRPGTDCGACGPRGCGAFRDEDAGATRARTPLRRLWRRRRR